MEDSFRVPYRMLNSSSPIFWTCMGQTSGNTVSLAANMNTYGLPNDFCELNVSPYH